MLIAFARDSLSGGAAFTSPAAKGRARGRLVIVVVKLGDNEAHDSRIYYLLFAAGILFKFPDTSIASLAQQQ
jgi:hypothetical protein